MGFEIGTEGISNDDIQSTKFVLSNADVPLDVSYFQFQGFGVRLANVGPAGRWRAAQFYPKRRQADWNFFASRTRAYHLVSLFVVCCVWHRSHDTEANEEVNAEFSVVRNPF